MLSFGREVRRPRGGVSARFRAAFWPGKSRTDATNPPGSDQAQTAFPVARPRASPYFRAFPPPAFLFDRWTGVREGRGGRSPEGRMLETLRRGQRWIMALVIAGVGFVFVFYLGLGGAPGGGGAGSGAVVEVDDLRFGPRDVDRVRRQQEEQYRQALGDRFDESAADQLDALAASLLVNQAILSREARELGFVASDDEVREYVRRQIPGAADESGRLQAEGLRGWAEGEFGTEARFVELVRMEVLADEILDLLRESVQVSDAEARQSLLHRREEVSLAWVGVDAKTPRADATISDEAIDELLTSDEARVRARSEAPAPPPRAPGPRSGRVPPPAGFHVLRAEERRDARSVPFEEVRRDLAREVLVQEEAARQAREAAERLAAAGP